MSNTWLQQESRGLDSVLEDLWIKMKRVLIVETRCAPSLYGSGEEEERLKEIPH